MPGLAVQNYATYPSMPGALRALCPVRRGVITGIRPYARYHVGFNKSVLRLELLGQIRHRATHELHRLDELLGRNTCTQGRYLDTSVRATSMSRDVMYRVHRVQYLKTECPLSSVPDGGTLMHHKS